MIKYGKLWHGIYSIVWYDRGQYGMIKYAMIGDSMVWYGIVQYDRGQYGMIKYDMIEYIMIWYSIV